MLQEAEVLLAQGKTTVEVCRALNVTEQTYYRWRKEYGGMGTEQARRLKDLETEDTPLKKLVAHLSLDRAILRRPCGELVSPDRRRQVLEEAQSTFQLSERRPCQALGQPRSTQRYVGCPSSDEESLTRRAVELASQ